ncbi:unnamed protein product [Caenorhabditis brenneri]
MLPLEQPAGVAEEANLDEDKLTDPESKKVIVKQSPGEKKINETVVEGPKLDEEMLRNEEMKKKISGEENVGTKKTFHEEDIETEKASGKKSIKTEKDSGEERFDYSKNIYEKKEESLKDNTKLTIPNEALPVQAAENTQNEHAHVLAPLEAQADDTDSEPRFPKRNRRVFKRYQEDEFEMKEQRKHRK